MEISVIPEFYYRLLNEAILSGGYAPGESFPLCGDCDNPTIIDCVTQLGPETSAWHKVVYQHLPETVIDGQVYFDVKSEVVEEFRAQRLLWSGRVRIRRPFFFSIKVRCRKCDLCKRARARHWAARAANEISSCPGRTWMVTLTLRPSARRHLRMAALRGAHVKLLTRWRQLYLKRIRKACKGVLRFMSVIEHHRDGTPHLHLLIHEVNPAAPILWRQLHDAWAARHGFVKANLVTNPALAAWYCSKYLTKQVIGRPAASKKYGLS